MDNMIELEEPFPVWESDIPLTIYCRFSQELTNDHVSSFQEANSDLGPIEYWREYIDGGVGRMHRAEAMAFFMMRDRLLAQESAIWETDEINVGVNGNYEMVAFGPVGCGMEDYVKERFVQPDPDNDWVEV